MYNQRAYNRGSHFNGEAQVSSDGDNWQQADVSDISSGGLMFCSPTEYAVGDRLWFDLVIRGFLSKFEVKSLGEVRRKIEHGKVFDYGIAFKGLSPEKKIQIDENVRNDRPVTGDGYEVD